MTPFAPACPYTRPLEPAIARHLSGNSPFGRYSCSLLFRFGNHPARSLDLGRSVLAFDTNPYAVTLTRAKLEAPPSLEAANQQLTERFLASQMRPRYDEKKLPECVRSFSIRNLQNGLRFAMNAMKRTTISVRLPTEHPPSPTTRIFVSTEQQPRAVSSATVNSLGVSTQRSIGAPAASPARSKAASYLHGRWHTIGGVPEVGQIGVADLKFDYEVDPIVTSPPT